VNALIASQVEIGHFTLADGEVHYREYRDRDRVLRAGPPKFEPFP